MAMPLEPRCENRVRYLKARLALREEKFYTAPAFRCSFPFVLECHFEIRAEATRTALETPVSILNFENCYMEFLNVKQTCRSPLWSSGQSSWLQIQRSWVRFPVLPDFLGSSGSGTGSTQPREDN
jgi:hypothetical protein